MFNARFETLFNSWSTTFLIFMARLLVGTQVMERFVVAVFVMFILLVSAQVSAQPRLVSADQSHLLMVDVVLKDADDLSALLKKVSDFSTERPDSIGAYPPIVLMLHGPEIEHFEKASYPKNEKMVNLAAKLDALGVIDMRICQTAANYFEVDTTTFPDFVQVVPNASKEIDQLQNDGYTFF